MNRHLLSILLIVVISIALYANTINNDFVYDDEYTITNNTLIKNIGNLPLLFDKKSYFDSSGEASYRPIVTFTYFIDYAIYGTKPWGYHLTNILFHSANGVLLYIFITLLMKETEDRRSDDLASLRGTKLITAFVLSNPALIISLLFVSHPVLTEAVNAISYREDLLCFFFYFATLITYRFLRYYSARILPPTRYLLYAASPILYFIALLSKEMAITLPLIICYLELFYNKQKGYNLLSFLKGHNVGLIIVTTAYAWIRICYSETMIEGSSPPWDFQVRIQSIPLLIMNYLKLVIFPIPLSADYVLAPVRSIFTSVFFGAFIINICLAVIVIKVKKADKLIAFGIVLFISALLPVYNIVRISNPFAERYLYLPLAGYAIALGLTLSSLLRTKNHIENTYNYRVIILFLIVITLFFSRGLLRNNAWKDNYSLWSDTLRKQPNSSRTHNSLGFIDLSKGRLDDAMNHFQAAIKINKYHADAHNNLGVVFLKKKQLDKAKEEFKTATGWQPKALYFKNLGLTYLELDQLDEAAQEFQSALTIDPNYFDAHYNLGKVYLKMGLIDKAGAEFEIALKLKPGHAETRQILNILPK